MALDKYGYFSDDGREFVITRPDTPAPWVNYISNGRYTGLVSNTGGGFSYWMDPGTVESRVSATTRCPGTGPAGTSTSGIWTTNTGA